MLSTETNPKVRLSRRPDSEVISNKTSETSQGDCGHVGAFPGRDMSDQLSHTAGPLL
jgi:hypothetical protein